MTPVEFLLLLFIFVCLLLALTSVLEYWWLNRK